MQIINTTGVATTTAKGTTNKSVASLLLSCEEAISALGSASISIQYQRKNDNIDVTNGFVPLLQFIATAGLSRIISADSTFATQVLINLTPKGAFEISDTENLIVEMKGLTSGKAYAVDGIEDVVRTKQLFKYEIKPVPAANTIFDLNVSKFDSMSFTDSSTVQELNLTTNGGTVKHSYRELQGLQRAFKPVAHFKQGASPLTNIAGFIALPCGGTQNINVVKDNTTIIDFYFRYTVVVTN